MSHKRWTFYVEALRQFIRVGSKLDDHDHHRVDATPSSGANEWCFKVQDHTPAQGNGRVSIAWMRDGHADLWLGPWGTKLSTIDREHVFAQRIEPNGSMSLAVSGTGWIAWNSTESAFRVDAEHARRTIFLPILTRSDGSELDPLSEGEAAIFQHASYKGRVFVFTGDFGDFPKISGLNDASSSIQVGPGTGATLFHDINYGGAAKDYTQSSSFAGDSENDRWSSIQIWLAVGEGHPLQQGEALLYAGGSYSGLGRLVLERQPHLPGLYHSLRVGPSTLVRLYQHGSFTGASQVVGSSIPQFSTQKYEMRFGREPPRGIELLDRSAWSFGGTYVLCDAEMTGDIGALGLSGELITRSRTPAEFERHLTKNDAGEALVRYRTPSGISLYVRGDGWLASSATTSTQFIQRDELRGRFSLTAPDGRSVARDGSYYRLHGDPGQRVFFCAVKIAAYESLVGLLEAGEVALYQNSNYWGKAYVLDSALKRFTWIPGLNDSISSAICAPNTAMTLYQHVDHQTTGGWSIDIAAPVPDFASEGIPNDGASSARPWQVADPRTSPFTVSALLQEDYRFEGDQATPVKAYRAVVKLSGGKRAGGSKIRVGATAPITVWRGAVAIQLGPDSVIELAPDALGEVALSIPASELTCPALKLRTPDMPEGLFVVAHPDEQAHHLLSRVTAEDLTKADHALLTGDHSASAPAIAQALQCSFGTLSHNYAPQPGIPTGTPSLPRSRRLTPRDGGAGSLDRFVRPSRIPDWRIELTGGTAKFTVVGDNTGRQIMNRRRVARSLGLSWRELWQRVKSGAASLASATVGALSSALQQGAQWVVTELEVIVDGAREVYQFVLDTAQKIGEFAGMILSAVAVSIERAIDWVSALFDWGDILRTKDYLRGVFESGLAEFELAADQLASSAEAYFETLGTDLLAQLEAVKARLGDQTLADTSGGHGTEEDVDATEQTNVQGAWVTSTIAQEPHGELPAFALPPGLSEFQDALAQLWEEVTAALDDPRVREAFSQALEDLKQIFARPASAATILPRLLIDALEGLLLVGIDVAKVLVGGLLRLAKYAFAALRSLVSAEAPMPMLSALYRRISGGAALSLLDASCLALAVPCTITHKLMHGRAPFPRARGALDAERRGDRRGDRHLLHREPGRVGPRRCDARHARTDAVEARPVRARDGSAGQPVRHAGVGRR
jgi:hypothetical protein